MKEVCRKVFADLEQAREFSNKMNDELKEKYESFNCTVWQCTDPWGESGAEHWINGVFHRYIVIADVFD